MTITKRSKGGTESPRKAVEKSKLGSFEKQVNCENLYHEENYRTKDWQPPFFLIISILLLIRSVAAVWGIINDCDEVYNYWEPLHLFLYGKGFQTWEYSPIYAIRSYFYIYLHYIPASWFSKLVNTFGGSKIDVFTLVRLMLGVFCLLGEYYAYRAISKKINVQTGRFFIVFSICSSGIFLASTSFVPSSFCMACTFYLLGAYLNENWTFGIFCVAFSTMVGWPFSAVLGLPIVVDMLFFKGLKTCFLLNSLIIGSGIGSLQVLTDSHYFGKTVVAPLNIFLYNVVSGPGPTLYGEEPLSFYIKNLFNNWNIMLFMALFGLPLSFSYFRRVNASHGGNYVFIKRFIPILLLAVTTATWLIIFGTQSHKEERFLFPIYPFIAFFAALACDAINRLWLKRLSRDKMMSFIFIACFAVLSVSRTYSIYKNYGSHVEIYRILNKELSSQSEWREFNGSTRICVGKEWHRFPSSFFIPQNVNGHRNVELHFIRSEFRGLLPKPFMKARNLIDVTRNVPSEMNNLNKEEVSRYVDLESCDYVVDVDMPATEREPDFREMSIKWKPIRSLPFIDVGRSEGFFGVFRAFYIPFYSDRANVMTTCTLYRQLLH